MKHVYRYNWRRSPFDARDHAYRASGQVVRPNHVDLSASMGPKYDQLQEGSCTANALARAFKHLHPAFKPAREFIYYNERAAEGTVAQDAGAYGRDGVKSLAKIGVCPETDCPYTGHILTRKPTLQAYADAMSYRISEYLALHTLDDMLDCLTLGFPFVFGFKVYESFESDAVAQTGMIPMPAHGEKLLGGHEVVGSGFDLLRRLMKIDNSWGGVWGDKGSAWMPFEFIGNRKLCDDFWTLRK